MKKMKKFGKILLITSHEYMYTYVNYMKIHNFSCRPESQRHRLWIFRRHKLLNGYMQVVSYFCACVTLDFTRLYSIKKATVLVIYLRLYRRLRYYSPCNMCETPSNFFATQFSIRSYVVLKKRKILPCRILMHITTL